MTEKWVPPKKLEELHEKLKGNQFVLNSGSAGPRSQKQLPRGSAPLQLYSLATPNGWKVGILLEELSIPYDAHVINIGAGHQFESGFVGANPNSKIPALIDHEGPGGAPFAVMESCAIMLYLAEKYPGFLPHDHRLRSECLQWLFWQAAGQGPMSGNFGHFMVYAPPDAHGARDYGVARYGMEVQRLCDVLERHLAGYGDFKGESGMRSEGPRRYLVGDQYTVADMACFPWVQTLLGVGYDREGQPRARDFLSVDKHVHLMRWVERLSARDQVKRGMRVCAGKPKPWMEKGHPLHPESRL